MAVNELVEVSLCAIDCNLDGESRLLLAVDQALAEVCQDTVKRGRVAGKRTVTVKIEIEPKLCDLDGEEPINTPEITWAVGHAVPGKKGNVTSAFVEDGVVKVSDRSTDARQRLLDLSADGVTDARDRFKEAAAAGAK